MKRLLALHPQYRFRSAVDGRYVTRLYALAHPRETIAERVPA